MPAAPLPIFQLFLGEKSGQVPPVGQEIRNQEPAARERENASARRKFAHNTSQRP